MKQRQLIASGPVVQVTTRIPIELFDRMTQASRERGISQALFIAQAIEAHIAKGGVRE